MAKRNLLGSLPASTSEEWVDELVTGGNVRIERIVSHGQISPPGFWYDQSEREWVLVLSGAARLQFQGSEEDILMGPGDAIEIAPHQKHRVAWTDQSQPTIWLAVFFVDEASER